MSTLCHCVHNKLAHIRTENDHWHIDASIEQYKTRHGRHFTINKSQLEFTYNIMYLY